MRYVKEFAVVLALLMLAGCAGKPVQESPVATDEGIPAGQIYLYGEIHGIAAIEEYEAERWKECYERGMAAPVCGALALHGPVAQPVDGRGGR